MAKCLFFDTLEPMVPVWPIKEIQTTVIMTLDLVSENLDPSSQKTYSWYFFVTEAVVDSRNKIKIVWVSGPLFSTTNNF